MNILAICGWATPPSWMKRQVSNHFSRDNIIVFYPQNPFDERESKNALSLKQYDLIIGYSLGSLWLLQNKRNWPQNSLIACLAPFLSFLKNHDLGGKTEKASLNYLIRQLEKSNTITTYLESFWNEMGIALNDEEKSEIPKREILVSGLEYLLSTQIECVIPQSVIGISGDQDPLIDSDLLKKRFPQLSIVENAGHHPGDLLGELSNIITPSQ